MGVHKKFKCKVYLVAQLVERSVWSVECQGFESHPRQLIFLRKSDCLGCAVLLCLVVCLTLLASFFLASLLSLKHVHVYIHLHVDIHASVTVCMSKIVTERRVCLPH